MLKNSLVPPERGDVSLLTGGLPSKKASLLARGLLKNIFLTTTPSGPSGHLPKGRLCVVGSLALPRISRNLEKFFEAEFFIEGQAHFSGL